MPNHPNPDIKRILDSAARHYEQPEFIEHDPIAIPRGFNQKADIEISGFLVATIAWGQRKTIVKNGWALMQRMDHSPADFICHASTTELTKLDGFVHRTFQPIDLLAFISVLRTLYTNGNGLEGVINQAVSEQDENICNGLVALRDVFYHHNGVPKRTRKHVPDIEAGAAAKRINMFLRWMVRSPDRGVDFGLWKRLNASQLLCPLDVHSGRTARGLGLLSRTANDYRAVLELTENLRCYDAGDPVRYDFALFGLSLSNEPLTIKP